MKTLLNKLNVEFNLTLAEAEEIAVEIEDVNEVKNTISNLKGKISSLGTVNLQAIVEYDEVSEKYQFMFSQEQDLEKAKEELLSVISEMTDKMKDFIYRKL